MKPGLYIKCGLCEGLLFASFPDLIKHLDVEHHIDPVATQQGIEESIMWLNGQELQDDDQVDFRMDIKSPLISDLHI
jgi:hypothetical protein